MSIYNLKRFIAFVTLIEINRAPEVYLTGLHVFGLIYYLFIKAFDLILSCKSPKELQMMIQNKHLQSFFYSSQMK